MTRLAAVDPGVHGCGVAIFDGGTLIEAHYTCPSRNPFHKSEHACGLVTPGIPDIQGRGNYARAHCTAREALAAMGWVDDLIVEHMFKYPGMDKINVNDLLDVQTVAAMVAASHSSAISVYPPQWKGNVPKKIMTERIKKLLTPKERAILDAGDWPKSLEHNVVDAIGIGLWRLGRLK